VRPDLQRWEVMGSPARALLGARVGLFRRVAPTVPAFARSLNPGPSGGFMAIEGIFVCPPGPGVEAVASTVLVVEGGRPWCVAE